VSLFGFELWTSTSSKSYATSPALFRGVSETMPHLRTTMESTLKTCHSLTSPHLQSYSKLALVSQYSSEQDALPVQKHLRKCKKGRKIRGESVHWSKISPNGSHYGVTVRDGTSNNSLGKLVICNQKFRTDPTLRDKDHPSSEVVMSCRTVRGNRQKLARIAACRQSSCVSG